MTGDIGRLLITIDNAVTTVWHDDACITHLIPSPTYDDDGVLLDVTISILKNKYSKDRDIVKIYPKEKHFKNTKELKAYINEIDNIV